MTRGTWANARVHAEDQKLASTNIGLVGLFRHSYTTFFGKHSIQSAKGSSETTIQRWLRRAVWTWPSPMTSVVDLLRLTSEIRSDEECGSGRGVSTHGAVKIDPRWRIVSCSTGLAAG